MDWGEQHPLMGGKSRRSRRSGTKGGEVTTCGAGPPPHIPGCSYPPPPPFPPPTATKASPPTQVSLLLNLDGGKVGQELHHHSGVPTGIQLRLVFARKFETLVKALIQKGLVSCFRNVLGNLGLPRNGRLCCFPILIHLFQLDDQLIKTCQDDFPLEQSNPLVISYI